MSVRVRNDVKLYNRFFLFRYTTMRRSTLNVS